MFSVKKFFNNFKNYEKTTINPYLTKKDKISLSWLSIYTITIILLLFQIINSRNQLFTETNNIKNNLNNTCIFIENLSNELSSIPKNVNQMTVNNINFILSSIQTGLITSVEIIENVTLWFINNYKNTLKCLLLLVVSGSIDLVEDASHVFEKSTNDALSAFQIQINNINNDLSNIQSKINNIPFANIQLPSIPSISINNITIPAEFYSSLENINNSFPEILLTIDNYLTTPFDILKTKINETNFNFESNITSSNSTKNICQEKIVKISEELMLWINKIYVYSIVILIVLIIIITIINIIYINYTDKIYIRKINEVIQKNNVGSTKDNILYILDYINYPIRNKIMLYLDPIIPKNQQKNLFKWFVNYIFYYPSYICFIMAISGILFTFIQIVVMKSLKYTILTNLTISIDSLINDIVSSNHNDYIDIINNNINATETNINNELFEWVNITTNTLNNTLNDVVSEITNFINATFKNTPLVNPIQDVINCLILIKIKGIQNGIAWIQSKSHVTLPYLDFSIIPLNTIFILKLLSPIIGNQDESSNEIQINNGLLIDFFNKYEIYLYKSLIIYYVLLIIWCIVLFMGIVKIIYIKNITKY